MSNKKLYFVLSFLILGQPGMSVNGSEESSQSTKAREDDMADDDTLTTMDGASVGGMSKVSIETSNKKRKSSSRENYTDQELLVVAYARGVYFYKEKFVTNRDVLSSHEPRDASDEETGIVRRHMMRWIKKQSESNGPTTEEFIMTETLKKVFCAALNGKRGDVNTKVKEKMMGA